MINVTGSLSCVLAPPLTAGRWIHKRPKSSSPLSTSAGVVTVRGQFEQIAGEGPATAEGSLAGTLSFEATPMTTKNKQRDKHLRSSDFSDTQNHPMVVLTVTETTALHDGALVCKGTLEAAGHREPTEFTAHVQDVTDHAVTMTADLVVDRARFGMTWSPMRIAANDALATVTARFVRP